MAGTVVADRVVHRTMRVLYIGIPIRPSRAVRVDPSTSTVRGAHELVVP